MQMRLAKEISISKSAVALKNERGQIAIFIALVFNVLFVFFAMIVNVGLLVHHKINLQNSVDLAAYYGASKQAEMLNAIAHVNYQIRQAYKLLQFRYHVIGNGGLQKPQPFYDWLSKSIPNENDESPKTFTSFCITYPPFSMVGASENYCQEASLKTIPLPGRPSVLSGLSPFGFFGLTVAIKTASDQYNANAQRGCRMSSEFNWYAMARFITAYKQDVKNRKQLLLALANEASKADFRDIEGASVREGVYKTLIKNLTTQNGDSLRSRFNDQGQGSGDVAANFEIINGLNVGDCGSKGAIVEPPGWLSEIMVFNPYWVTQADCDSANKEAVSYKPLQINDGSQVLDPKYRTFLTDEMIQQFRQYIDEPDGTSADTRLWKSSAGFEKNPWCMAYVGVKASASPRIPFSPLGSVTLKAQAFAKPFGGKIGPWYGTTWPYGALESPSKDKLTDEVGAYRVAVGEFDMQSLLERRTAGQDPGFSRYMGDQVGVRSNLTISHFSKAIHERGPIQFSWWKHILETEIGPKDSKGDPLAWNSEADSVPTIRETELAGIAPDNFDISHYMIEPDFYDNYLVKLKKGYQNEFDFEIRGDLGSRVGTTDQELLKFGIKDQIKLANDSSKNIVDVSSKISYLLSDVASVLTSWQVVSPDSYRLDKNRFGKCLVPNEEKADPIRKVPGLCIAGGRVGYSVKLVSGDYLKSTDGFELGGKGSSGSIKNRPPDGW